LCRPTIEDSHHNRTKNYRKGFLYRKVWRSQRGNGKPYTAEGQTIK